MRIRSLVGVALLTSAGIALAACGDASSSASPPSSDVGPSQTAAGPVVADFTLSTGPASSFSLVEHAGDVVVLYFSFPG
ncbi:MAG: hypothetical protein IH862_07155 [Chloroflexi bacterium]|nr:hypothetical protein [Chloroflexota bacterium]